MMENPHNQEIYLIKFRGQDDEYGSPERISSKLHFFLFYLKKKQKKT